MGLAPQPQSPLARLLAESPRTYVLGVSLISNRFFTKSRVEGYLRRYDDRPFVLLLADSLEAINYRYIRGFSTREAIERARHSGETYLQGFQKLVPRYPNLLPVLTSSVETLSGFHDVRCAVARYFRHDAAFRRDIREEVVENLGPRGKHLLSHSHDPRIESYLLGEVAITLFLYRLAGGNRVTQLSPRATSILAHMPAYANLLEQVGVDPRAYEYRWIGEEDEYRAAA